MLTKLSRVAAHGTPITFTRHDATPRWIEHLAFAIEARLASSIAFHLRPR
jgi:hypothetical protein